VGSSELEQPAPLGGVRVVAVGAFVAGNVCPLVLAELGADVVKVESLRRPEPLRSYYSPDHAPIVEPSGVRTTAMFSCLTRSVRSVCIEVDQPGGSDTLRSLVESADILIENMGPGVIERWGCSYEDLTVRNPRLVMVSISGYGRTGPRGDYRAYGSSIANYLGLATVWAPDPVHFDFVAAYHGAVAAIAAHERTKQTGAGTYVDLSQVEAGTAVMAPVYLDALVNGRPWSFEHNEVPGAVLSTVVQCAGHDAWAAVELEDLDDLRTLAHLLARPEFAVSIIGDARARAAEVCDALREWAAQRTPMQVSVVLQQAGLAAAPVQNTEDLWRDPQLRTRNAFVEVDHPDVGLLEQPQSPDRMSMTPGHVRGRSRRLGEDTLDVLEEWLGMASTDAEVLRAVGAIYQVSDKVP
jgi:crotonobetainyl-CoA:carnitine CoA-transferase CaiB-like acyl-CoA transferase